MFIKSPYALWNQLTHNYNVIGPRPGESLIIFYLQ